MMTNERKNQLYDEMFGWICEHIRGDEDLYITLHKHFGMTQEELHEHSIESLDKFFKSKTENDEIVKRLADYAVSEGTQNSEDGRWSITYDELFYHFGIEIDNLNENGKELEKELQQREEIIEAVMAEDTIEITYHPEYCENYQSNPDSELSDSESDNPNEEKAVIIKVPLLCKQSDFDISSCAIVKTEELSAEEFAGFLRHPLAVYTFLIDFNREGYEYKDGNKPCIMVLGEGTDDGVCVYTSGADYPRYTAYIPNARQIVEQQIMNVDQSQLKKAIFMLEEEFQNLLADFDMKADIGYDGICISDISGETFYDDETLNEILSEHFGVNVTSTHADDCDLVGVWIVYKSQELCEQNTETEDIGMTM